MTSFTGPVNGEIAENCARALRWAANGFRVFPWRRINGRKIPCIKGWPARATLDPETIRKWWMRWPDTEVGTPLGTEYVLVDCDRHGGPDGVENYLEACKAQSYEPHTWSQDTPTGGRHYLYRGSGSNTTHKVAPAIDTRGGNGFMGIYASPPDEWEIDALPPFVAAVMQKAQREPRHATDQVEFADAPNEIDRALHRIKWTVEKYGEPVEGSGSDEATYKLAAWLLDQPLTTETVEELLAEHYAPHFDREWIVEKVASAAKNRRDDRGHDAEIGAKEAFSNYREEAQNMDGTAWPARRTARQAMTINFPKTEWLWDNLLLAGRPNMYTGDKGAGKTTLALHLAVAVAAGAPLLGYSSKWAPVYLLLGEDDPGSVRDTLDAIRQGLGVEEDVFDHIEFLSTLEYPNINPWLVTINKEGKWEETPFMREYLRPILAGFAAPPLFVIDPIAKFAQFDRYDDVAARALSDRWLTDICNIGGAGRGTVLVTDHPSKTGMREGVHDSGSVQLSNSFPVIATILKDKHGWVPDLGGQRKRRLTFKMLRAKGAIEEEFDIYQKEGDKLLLLPGAAGEARRDHRERVYGYVRAKVEEGERLLAAAKTKAERQGLAEQFAIARNGNGGGITPDAIAQTLHMDAADVRAALKDCVGCDWLRWRDRTGNLRDGSYRRGSYILGAQEPGFLTREPQPEDY